MEETRSAFLERKVGPKLAFLLVTFAVLAEMCVLYRTSHVRIPRSLEEYKDHGDLLTDERNWISTRFLFLGLPTAVCFSLFSWNLFCWEKQVILFTVKPETKLYSLKFKNKINRFLTRYASEGYTQWKKVQGTVVVDNFKQTYVIFIPSVTWPPGCGIRFPNWARFSVLDTRPKFSRACINCLAR